MADKTQTKRQRRYIDAQAERGMKKVSLWVHEDDRARVKLFIAGLNLKRKKTAKPTVA